ncbi:hypothetical protein AB3S75_012985 [Citrus x aurantiifolia]
MTLGFGLNQNFES